MSITSSGFDTIWATSGGGGNRGRLSGATRESTGGTGGKPGGGGEGKPELAGVREAAAGRLLRKKPNASGVRRNPGQGGGGCALYHTGFLKVRVRVKVKDRV